MCCWCVDSFCPSLTPPSPVSVSISMSHLWYGKAAALAALASHPRQERDNDHAGTASWSSRGVDSRVPGSDASIRPSLPSAGEVSGAYQGQIPDLFVIRCHEIVKSNLLFSVEPRERLRSPRRPDSNKDLDFCSRTIKSPEKGESTQTSGPARKPPTPLLTSGRGVGHPPVVVCLT